MAVPGGLRGNRPTRIADTLQEAQIPNRISSSGRRRPDRFNLDQPRWLVPRGPSGTAVNCN
jgi:hypothetical protein